MAEAARDLSRKSLERQRHVADRSDTVARLPVVLLVAIETATKYNIESRY
jgi:hypothetical protein